jgi:hypothetical protein
VCVGQREIKRRGRERERERGGEGGRERLFVIVKSAGGLMRFFEETSLDLLADHVDAPWLSS